MTNFAGIGKSGQNWLVNQITSWVASKNFDAEPGKPIAILLHGYGSNEKDLPDIMGFLPEIPWLSPRAPEKSPHGGNAWFQITSPGNPSEALVAPSTESLWAWIDDNIPESCPIVAIGFSQGGLMATQLLRTRPERLAATIILAGFTQAAAQPGDDYLRSNKPSVIYCRGLQDGVITADAVARTNAWLQAHTKARTFTYPGLGHSIDQRVMADAAAYLQSVLA